MKIEISISNICCRYVVKYPYPNVDMEDFDGFFVDLGLDARMWIDWEAAVRLTDQMNDKLVSWRRRNAKEKV